MTGIPVRRAPRGRCPVALSLCHLVMIGTDEQLAVRREHGLRLLRQGKSAREIAEQIGVTERSVRRWRQEAETPKRKKHQHPLGRP